MDSMTYQQNVAGKAVNLDFRPEVDVEFSIAFQPIVDVSARRVVSFEALVRGTRGEPAAEVFARVSCEDLYSFDQACRLKAISMAARLDLRASLDLNFLPGAMPRSEEYLQGTLRACWNAGFPVQRLVFELTETERLHPHGSAHGVLRPYAFYGFQTAIDDFGSGFAGLRRLAEYRPDFVKLDRSLVSGIHRAFGKQMVVRGVRDVCQQFSIQLVAEGVETVDEYHWLRSAGIHLHQGYYFAQPAFEALAEVAPAVY